jgi:hypothetical protein
MRLMRVRRSVPGIHNDELTLDERRVDTLGMVCVRKHVSGLGASIGLGFICGSCYTFWRLLLLD